MMNSSLISSDVEYEKKDKNLNNDDSNDNNTENFCDIKENLENIADIELKMKNAKKRIPFWAEDPNILFHQKYMFEFFPVSNMSYQQKLNAITRTVILLVLFSFGYSNNIRILIIGMITLLAIFTLHHFHIKDKMKREMDKWNPLIQIPFSQEKVEDTITKFACVVDSIESREFKPPSLQKLQDRIRGTKQKFATRVCRNCDARFSCDAYREYAQVTNSFSGGFTEYINDLGNADEVENSTNTNALATPPPTDINDLI